MSASGVAFNSVLMLAVALPSVWWVRWLLSVCNFDAVADAQPPSLGLELLMKQGHALAFDKEWMCGLYYHRPVVFENIVFFLNVDVLFWLISLAQRSTWLIDPWWQFAPVGILAFIGTHPRARLGPRAFGASLCLLVWAARLTHNYFR